MSDSRVLTKLQPTRSTGPRFGALATALLLSAAPPLAPLPLKRPHLHDNFGEDW